MMISQLPVPINALISTDIFKEADKKWPFESWDDREWNRVCKSAMKELNDGNSGK